MSGYYFRSLQFDVRQDVDDRVLSVLSAVAEDRRPDAGALESLHPVVRHYLSDPERLTLGEASSGSPVRVTFGRSWMGSGPDPVPKLSIEWTLHDDDYAGGGYLFELWVWRLVHRPIERSPDDPARYTIGWTALYPNDYLAELVSVDPTGINKDSRRWASFEELDQAWDDLREGPWEGY